VAFQVMDVVRDHFGEHPIMTTPIHDGGDVEGRDTVKAKYAEAPYQRSAYALWVPSPPGPSLAPIRLEPTSVRIEPFAVTNEKFSHLSSTSAALAPLHRFSVCLCLCLCCVSVCLSVCV
jgi:hypothetical protein